MKLSDIESGLDMTCNLCTARGHINQCKRIRCSVHESWYAQYALTVLNLALQDLKKLKEAVNRGDYLTARKMSADVFTETKKRTSEI